MANKKSQWIDACKALASAAGYCHDVGKVADFQDKIRSAIALVDPVRHEWISLYIIREMLEGKTWDSAWKALENHEPAEERWMNIAPFDRALDTLKTALLYIVATHHRLPTMMTGINHYNHVRDDDHCARRRGDIGPEAMAAVTDSIAALSAFDGKRDESDRLYWRCVANTARVAMILADHAVSMEIRHDPDTPEQNRLYANTDREKKILNQSLDWHLLQVGRLSAEMVTEVDGYEAPCLSPEVVQRICAEGSRKKQYVWQNRATKALIKSRNTRAIPHLVLNMAATGTGKTRMNVRAVCALGNPDGTGIRLMTALNLRTLTLQTRDAYAEQLQIPADMLAGVIGDKATLKMHNYQKQQARTAQRARKIEDDTQLVDDDENLIETEFEAVSNFRYDNPPSWLSRFLKTKPYMAPVIGAPVLVSTIDFLIAAGEPQMQGNHALAMLRLQTSDLILDEIDSYDPKAFLAVMRLVTLSAFFGRNVVASSATLPAPVAKMLWQSYKMGSDMRHRKTGDGGRFKTAIIDNDTLPTIGAHRKAEGFMRTYNSHVKRMLKKLKGKCERRCFLQEVLSLSEKGWLQSILNAAVRLHKENCWVDPATKCRLSMGLVRVANIHTAVMVSSYLSEKLGQQVRIVCYHSQHLMMQRFHIEQKLDALLNRKNGSSHILCDSDIRSTLDNAQSKDVLFIVVATPVEEIGRDHDFDWGVIEPSSIQSLIQAPGRVNRHRLKKIGWYRFKDQKTGEKRKRLRCNTAIMQYNFRAIVHMYREEKYRAFCQPGLEMEFSPYPTHNLLEMLDWDVISKEQIDARQRFYVPKIDGRKKESNGDITRRYSFAQLDDAALEDATSDIFGRLLGTTKEGYEWMGVNTYLDSPLREKSQGSVNMIWRESAPRNIFLCKLAGTVDQGMLLKMPVTLPRVANDWLILEDAELIDKAKKADLVIDDGMRVNISVGKMKRDGTVAQSSLLEYVVHHRSFGFFRDKQR